MTRAEMAISIQTFICCSNELFKQAVGIGIGIEIAVAVGFVSHSVPDDGDRDCDCDGDTDSDAGIVCADRVNVDLRMN